MKKFITICLLITGCTFLYGQGNARAREVLDKTGEALSKAGSIQVTFDIRSTRMGQSMEDQGTIRLKGEKFMLETEDVSTWFDGKTQWSYFAQNDEVNISEPTAEELQSINPYALLSLYKGGYNYTLEENSSAGGKACYRVTLTTNDRRKDIRKLILYIAKADYQPVRIVAEMRDKSITDILITSYKKGENYNDNFFRFDAKKYPRVEIIDLR
ncbi:MAG: hypothetical protein LUD15_07785 [Bacteroides sp.]|nr:hypothetical protein [Bacteroides sp.]